MPAEEGMPFWLIQPVIRPAAGANLVITGPGRGVWRVESLRFDLVTSAVVANRTVNVVVDDGATEVWRTSAALVQPAGQTVHYCAAPGLDTGGPLATTQRMPLPREGAVLLAGWRLATTVDLLDVGDQITAIGVLVQEFPSGPGPAWYPTTSTQHGMDG